MQVRTLIHDAVCYLQGQDPDKAAFKNDIGFSKADSQVGHIAANLPPEHWTPELTVEIAAVLVKYLNTQLTHFDGDAIRAIAAEARGRDHIHSAHKKLKAEEKLAQFRKSRKIVWERWQGGAFRFVISWDWADPEKLQILDAVRELPGRDYVPYRWGVPVSSKLSVKEFAEKWSFDDSALPEMKVNHIRLVPNDPPLYNPKLDPVEYCEPPLPLYPHQVEGIDYLRANKKALLTDEMGLGKTIEALMALPSDTAALVVAPASLKGSWEREAKVWRPDLTPVVLKGKKNFRWPVLGEIVIVNYAILPKEGTGSWLDWEVNAIVDEAHYLKKFKAARTRNWRALSADIHDAGGSTWLMTGTPLQTRPSDLWGILQSTGTGVAKLGFGSWAEFMDTWGGYQGDYGVEWNPNAIDAVKAEAGLKKVSFGRKRLDVLPDLPRKRWKNILVKVPRGVGKIDRESLDELEAWAGGGAVPLAGKLAEARRELADAKVKAAIPFIDDLIEGGGGPLVVFSAHVAPVKFLGSLDKWEVICGDTPADRRTEIVARFQAGELDGIAGTVGAMGVGLTLTRACRMVFIDLPWSPAEIAQSEDRICRIGAVHDACDYFTIVADTEVDHIINQSLKRKDSMIEHVDEAREHDETRDHDKIKCSYCHRMLERKSFAGVADEPIHPGIVSDYEMTDNLCWDCCNAIGDESKADVLLFPRSN